MISIFIRTYHKDINWLRYCLKSIDKNLTGWSEVVICIPTGQAHLVNFTRHKVVTCKLYKDDYLGQQISKIQAHRHCSGDYILFVDSDVLFFPGADVRDYFSDNKPVILKDRYENVGDAMCWKEPTEKLFCETVEYEYMRRAPQLFRKDTLELFGVHFPHIEQYIEGQPYREFSEFNALGFFAEKMQPDSYEIIDISQHAAPENKAIQFWSWGGLDKNLKEVKRIVGEAS